MSSVVQEINSKFMKKAVVDVHSGDTVRVHQRVKEGNKERVQVFQGLVIKTSKQGSHLSRITVRRIDSGVGVEKSFLMHSPSVVKVEVTRRSKVRRNYLSYMRARTGKSARLTNVGFDRNLNVVAEEETKEPAADETKSTEEPKVDQAEEPEPKPTDDKVSEEPKDQSKSESKDETPEAKKSSKADSKD